MLIVIIFIRLKHMTSCTVAASGRSEVTGGKGLAHVRAEAAAADLPPHEYLGEHPECGRLGLRARECIYFVIKVNGA